MVCGCLLGFCARRATPPSSAADCLARVLDQGAFLAATEAAVQVRLRQYRMCVGVGSGWSCGGWRAAWQVQKVARFRLLPCCRLRKNS